MKAYSFQVRMPEFRELIEWVQINTPAALSWYTICPSGLFCDRVLVVDFIDLVQATYFKIFWADYLVASDI